MNVVVIIHNRKNTGPYPKIIELCKVLLENNTNKVTIYCTSLTSKFFIKKSALNEIEIIEFPDFLFGRLRQGFDLWNTFRRILYSTNKKIDIVHLIDCRPVVIFPGLFLKKFHKVPIVMSWWDLFSATSTERNFHFYHYRFFQKIERYFDYNFRKYADYALPISNFLKQELIRLGFPKSKIEVIRIGSNIEPISLPKELLREKLGLPPSKIILIYVGAIFPLDFQLLLNSLLLLKKKGNVEFETILVGKFEVDRNFENELDIKVTGFIDHSLVITYLMAADICLLPFKRSLANIARWPSKFPDYAISGNPIVFTNVSDVKYLNDDYNFGYFSQDDSPESFSEAIWKSINDKDNWAGLNRNCKLLVEEKLNNRKNAQKILNIYKEVIKK